MQYLIFNFCRLVTESVHWYLTKEKYDDLARTVKDISRANNKQLTELTQYNLDMLMAKGEKASAYLFYLTSFIGLSKGVSKGGHLQNTPFNSMQGNHLWSHF